MVSHEDFMLQGLVCPGMLVLLTNDQGVKVIQESEYCPLFSVPATTTNYRSIIESTVSGK